jgi:hypothetical protein
VGGIGAPAGVTLLDAADTAPGPVILKATTVKVYGVPFTSPVTVTGLDVPVPVNPPGDDVTVYEITAEPPLGAGGVKLTVAWLLAAIADTPVGAPGTILGITLLEATDAPDVPTPLVAVMVKV